MSRALLTFVAVSAASLGLLSSPSDAGANDPEIVFNPPLTVNIRQTNGAPARGELLSVNDKEVLLRIVSGKEVRMKLERVRSIKNSTSTFEFRPADETFDELCRRIDEVPGAKLMGELRGVRRSTQNRPATTESSSEDPHDRRGTLKNQASPFQAQEVLGKGRLGPNGLPTKPRKDEEEAPVQSSVQIAQNEGKPSPTSDAEAEPDEPPVPGSTIYLCSNCEKELPLSFVSGDACPHCGKVAVFADEAADNAANGPATVSAPGQNPFATGGPATVPTVPVVPTAVEPVPVSAPPAAGGGGMGLADIPLLGKVGIFAGFVILGWFVLQRR
jgi:hypothetical protein